jgi:hypothetical protein
MTTKPKAKRYRIRRDSALAEGTPPEGLGTAEVEAVMAPASATTAADDEGFDLESVQVPLHGEVSTSKDNSTNISIDDVSPKRTVWPQHLILTPSNYCVRTGSIRSNVPPFWNWFQTTKRQNLRPRAQRPNNHQCHAQRNRCLRKTCSYPKLSSNPPIACHRPKYASPAPPKIVRATSLEFNARSHHVAVESCYC